MEDKLIDYLKNKQIFILSPHFDDAVLSMGMLMYKLKKYRNITVINCFTQAHNGPHTLSSKQYLRLSGYTDAEKLYKERAFEDRRALTSLNIKYINLDFAEALFRRKSKTTNLGKIIAELDHLYPTYRWHIIKNFNPADITFIKLKTKLAELIPQDGVVFAPFGIGGHVDHLITRRACDELFNIVFYYLDFPYYTRLKYFGLPPVNYQKFDLAIDLPVKTQLIGNYKSQLSGLFSGDAVPPHAEHYYLPKSYKSL